MTKGPRRPRAALCTGTPQPASTTRIPAFSPKPTASPTKPYASMAKASPAATEIVGEVPVVPAVAGVTAPATPPTAALVDNTVSFLGQEKAAAASTAGKRNAKVFLSEAAAKDGLCTAVATAAHAATGVATGAAHSRAPTISS